MQKVALDVVIQMIRKMEILHTPESEEHADRTSAMAVKIGDQLTLTNSEMELLMYGADIHDMGKVFIDANILDKKGKLNKAQRAQMERHCEIGYEALEVIKPPKEILDIVLYHQEHWDGSGYPCRLKGDDIPLMARIVCIADVWDALLSDRSYRNAYNQVKALEIMVQHSAWFDPRLFGIFLGIVRGS